MPADLTPDERSLRARMAAHQSWANTPDPSARTKPAREGLLAKFEAEVDPEGTLDPAERRRRAEHARRAYMAGLSLKSAQARRLRAQADDLDAEAAKGGDAA